MVISKELEIALLMYRAALAAAPKNMEAGWIDDFQRRERRLVDAINRLLEVAGKE